MFIRFRKATTLEVCAYNDELQLWGSGMSESFEKGEDIEVALLREKEDTMDIEFPDGGVAFDLPKADVDVLPVDVVTGSRILEGILPWPWEAEVATILETSEVGWDIQQSQTLHNGVKLDFSDTAFVINADAGLREAEAKLLAKAPEMYVLLRQLLAGQPVMADVGRLINELELSIEKPRKRKGNKR